MKTEELLLADLGRRQATDSESGLNPHPQKFMISGEAPLLMGKASELLIQEIALRAWRHTERNRRRTLQRQDVAAAVGESEEFDFLIDIVPRIPTPGQTAAASSTGTTSGRSSPQGAGRVGGERVSAGQHNYSNGNSGENIASGDGNVPSRKELDGKANAVGGRGTASGRQQGQFMASTTSGMNATSIAGVPSTVSAQSSLAMSRMQSTAHGGVASVTVASGGDVEEAPMTVADGDMQLAQLEQMQRYYSDLQQQAAQLQQQPQLQEQSHSSLALNSGAGGTSIQTSATSSNGVNNQFALLLGHGLLGGTADNNNTLGGVPPR